MRVAFKTTLEDELVNAIKITAIKQKVSVNDILEILISKYLQGEIAINLDIAKKKE